jgi:hypothetical protein
MKYVWMLFLCVITPGCGGCDTEPGVVEDTGPKYRWEEGKEYYYVVKLTLAAGGESATTLTTFEITPGAPLPDAAWNLNYNTENAFLSLKSKTLDDRLIAPRKGTQKQEKLQVTSKGVVTTDPTTTNLNLPYLFGPAWRMVLDRLPQPGMTEWSDSHTYTTTYSEIHLITAKDKVGFMKAEDRLKPPAPSVPKIPAHAHYGLPPIYASSPLAAEHERIECYFTEAYAQGKDQFNYRILDESTDFFTIEKRFDFSATDAKTTAPLGSGELKGILKFDRQKGVPTESLLEGKVSYVHPGGNFECSVKLDCKLWERAKFLAQADSARATRELRDEIFKNKDPELDELKRQAAESGGTDKPIPSSQDDRVSSDTLGAQTARLDAKHWRDFVMGVDQGMRGYAVSPNGKWLFVTFEETKLNLIDLESGETNQIYDYQESGGTQLSHIAFSGDSSTVALGHDYKNKFWIFKISETGTITFQSEIETALANPSWLHLNQDGSFLIVVGKDNSISRISIADKKVVNSFPVDTQNLWRSQPIFDPTGERALFSDGVALLRLDLVKGALISREGVLENKVVEALRATISPDGRLLFVSLESEGGWVAPTKQLMERTTLKNYSRMHKQPRFSPSGQQLLAVNENKIFVWDTDTGEELGTIIAGDQISFIDRYQLTPDGKHLITTHSLPKVIRVFNLNKVE